MHGFIMHWNDKQKTAKVVYIHYVKRDHLELADASKSLFG